MSVAETAKLVADLELKDHVSGPAKAVHGAIRELDAGVARTSTRFAGMSRVSHGLGSAFGHARHELGGLLGAAGIFGAAGVGIGIGKFLEESIQDAKKFGDTVVRLKAITGEGNDSIVGLTGTLSYFGIQADKQTQLVGMMTKNVGNLTLTSASATKFQKLYGIELLDSAGKVKSITEIIAQSSDFFNNKNIPATQKAAAMAKLFGRSWQDLIPVLSAGSTELERVNEHEKKLNPITDANIEQMKKLKTAQRDFSSALETMKVQVGLVIIPLLTDLAKASSEFLSDPGNRSTIIGFFKEGVQFARDFGKYLGDEVIPTVRDLARAADTFWNALPGPIKELLIKGLVANQTMKFLFGFNVAGMAGDVVGAAVKEGFHGILGQFGLTRGSSPANPMFVSGGIGGAAAAEGGMVAGGGMLSKIGRAVSILGAVTIAGASIAALAEEFGNFQQVVSKAQSDLQEKADAARTQDVTTALGNLDKTVQGLHDVQGFARLVGDTAGGKQEMDALTNLSDAVTNNGHLTAKQVVQAIDVMKRAQVEATSRGNQKVADHIGENIRKLQAATARGNSANEAAINQLKSTVRSGDATQTGLLADINRKPTNISVTVPVTTSVSVRDLDTQTRTVSRYGFVAQ